MKSLKVCLQVFAVFIQVEFAASFCPEYCECSDVYLSVSCKSAGLEILPITLNPSIKRLQLQHNAIKAIDAALGFYGQLDYLDLSYNQLLNIPEKGFKSQRRLVQLKLANNRIQRIDNDTLFGLDSLKILNLRRNYIEHVGELVLAGVPHLQELDLGQNRISTIEPTAFLHTKHLKVLYLDDNHILTVPTNVFVESQMVNLLELHLEGNRLASISDQGFVSLPNLISLDLSRAGLANLSDFAFEGLETSLKLLKLSANPFTVMPTAAIASLYNLEELYVGQTQIAGLTGGELPLLPRLQRIDLSRSSQLRLVTAGTFVSSHNDSSAAAMIEWLSLAGSRQVQLEDGAFRPLANLRCLDMSDTGLRTVPRHIVDGLSGLQQLDVGENPLRCDCGLSWLRPALQSGHQSNLSLSGACAEPRMFSGHRLTEVVLKLEPCPQGNQANDALGGGGENVMPAGFVLGCICAGLVTGISLFLVADCQRRKMNFSVFRKKLEVCVPLPQDHNSQPDMDDGLCFSTSSETTQQDLGKVQDVLFGEHRKDSNGDEDYFLTLSKDGKTFRQIRVCEL